MEASGWWIPAGLVKNVATTGFVQDVPKLCFVDGRTFDIVHAVACTLPASFPGSLETDEYFVSLQ